MAVAKGNREYKYQKTFVKVFRGSIENIEKEINDWIMNNEDKCEIVDIKFTSDCQANAVVMAVCHHIPLSME